MKKKVEWRILLGALIWSEIFIAIPFWLGSVISTALITNPFYLSLCIRLGFWGVVLGMTLPELAFAFIGVFIGFCNGIMFGCHVFGKERFTSWILGEKETWLSKFTRRVIGWISN